MPLVRLRALPFRSSLLRSAQSRWWKQTLNSLPPGRRTMSWKSHGTDNASLVQALRDNEIVTSESVESAMRLVDRGYYARDRQTAYVDAPQAIGSAATISAPHMHAYCLELMRDSLKPGNRVLDVGSGSGYLTAVMAHMVRGEGGLAVGLEHIPSLHRAGEENCRRDPGARTLLDSGELVFVLGDGRRGHLESSPYDCIHVGAAATSIPSNLLEQLARGGRLVCPVGKEGGSQRLVCVDRDRDSGKLSERIVMGVQYVPLCSKEHQLGRW